MLSAAAPKEVFIASDTAGASVAIGHHYAPAPPTAAAAAVAVVESPPGRLYLVHPPRHAAARYPTEICPTAGRPTHEPRSAVISRTVRPYVDLCSCSCEWTVYSYEGTVVGRRGGGRVKDRLNIKPFLFQFSALSYTRPNHRHQLWGKKGVRPQYITSVNPLRDPQYLPATPTAIAG